MGIAEIAQLAQQAVWTVVYVSSPILIVAMGVGLIVSVFQATTSIQEQTLTFVPKMLAMYAVIFVLSGWMGSVLVSYTRSLFDMLPALAR